MKAILVSLDTAPDSEALIIVSGEWASAAMSKLMHQLGLHQPQAMATLDDMGQRAAVRELRAAAGPVVKSGDQ